MSRLLFASALLLAACGGKKTPDPDANPAEGTDEMMADAEMDSDADSSLIVQPALPETDPSLAILNTRWELTPQTEGSDEPIVYFQVDAGAPPNLNGYAGCNRFFGTGFRATTDTVAFGPVGSTRRACPYLGKEQQFLGGLAEVDGWSVTGDRLTLTASGEPKMTFVAGKMEETP